MLYLIDANVLICANNDYYPIDYVPQFWQWLEGQARAGSVKIPLEIHNEIAVSNDRLSDWVCSQDRKTALILNEEIDTNKLDDVVIKGYGEGKNLTDSDLEKVGQDPCLIAYAYAAADRVVVTKETPDRVLNAATAKYRMYAIH